MRKRTRRLLATCGIGAGILAGTIAGPATTARAADAPVMAPDRVVFAVDVDDQASAVNTTTINAIVIAVAEARVCPDSNWDNCAYPSGG